MAVSNGTSTGIDVKKADQIELGSSATEGDVYKNGGAGGFGLGGVFPLYFFGGFGLGNNNNELLPDLPSYWSKARDAVLFQTIKREPYWNGAVKKAIAKGVTQQWDLKFNDRYRNTAEKIRDLFKESNGRRGFKYLLGQHLQDYFTTDNGAFLEIDREDNTKPGSRILGLYHLDSMRCLGRDSRVSLPNGKTVSIEKLVRSRYDGEVLALTKDGNFIPKKVTGWHETKLGDRYWLHLKVENATHTFGKQKGLWVTNDHEILTPEGWARAEQLKIGDKVITQDMAPSAQQIKFITGALLGDSGLSFSGQKARLTFGHAPQQKEWLDLKLNSLKGLKISNIRGNSFLQATTCGTPAFNQLYKDWYVDGVKVLPKEIIEKNFSPLMLATWYLDDGDMAHAKRTNQAIRLATHCFTKEETEWLIQLLTDKGYTATIQKAKEWKGKRPFYIYITTEGSKKFFNDIAPYIPPSMRYKLPANSNPFDLTLWDLEPAYPFADTISYLERGDNGEQVTAFCIDVEDEHNFIASGMVVHNCYRTGDPDVPVIYADLHNHYHYLAWWQVWDISDTPNPRNNYFGVGDCAAAGAYERIRRMVAIRLYEYQRMTARTPYAMTVIGGITPIQLETWQKANEAAQLAKGNNVFGGHMMIPIMTKDPVSTQTIEMTKMPDNYKAEEEIDQAALEYSLALGISKTDLKPLTGRMAGTATQSQVMDSQSDSSGLGLWSGAFEDFINEMVLPSTVSFFWAFNKTNAKKAEADVANIYATAASALAMNQILTPQQANNWLVDMDVLGPEYLQQTDITQAAILAEDDKPDVVDPQTGQPVAQPAQQQGQPTPPPPPSVGQAVPGQGQSGDTQAQVEQILGTKF